MAMVHRALLKSAPPPCFWLSPRGKKRYQGLSREHIKDETSGTPPSVVQRAAPCDTAVAIFGRQANSPQICHTKAL
ncbi:hypothetical protein AL486_12705 [Pandoraea apista]|nr:hypothetical protein AL486_12705 [Pandoraea apista]PTE03017.1 hypothetical protein C7830_02085 [Pandoraea apista]